MSRLHTAGLGLALAFAALGTAHAAPVVGSGGGYFGTANYGNGAGSVVGPYASWAECNNALQAAINNAVNNFGYTLVSMHPCSYTPPFSGVMHHQFELAVVGDKDGDTAHVAAVLLDEVKRIRDAHDADGYDAAVGELVLITAPLRKKDTPKK